MFSALLRSRVLRPMLLAAALIAAAAGEARAQWSTTYEQFYLEAKHNWKFRHNYPAADRLFNAFDYGHAILYETLWAEPNAPVSRLEEKEYDFITQRLLPRPPRVPLEEGAIEIRYAQLAPEAKAMFEWAHILHRQIYDVLADERLSEREQDAEVARLVAYYKTRPDLAFSSRPKSMDLMEGQAYSLVFRRKYPKFNGLIWAYHWLQVGLYEPLLAAADKDERQTGVLAAVARFRQMIEDPPSRMPRVMPMTPAIAPRFTARYQEAAIIFDNLHALHDVISDVLASPQVPRDRKRAEILLAARRYRDDTSFVMTDRAWRDMAVEMGIENQGGLVTGVLTSLPAPTLPVGAAMAHARHGQHGQTAQGARDTTARADAAHAGHGADTSTRAARADTTRAGHEAHGEVQRPAAGHRDTSAMHAEMMELHMRMLEDPVIRQRILADTAMRRMMSSMIQQMPEEHRGHMESMMRAPAAGGASGTARASRPAARSTQPRRTSTRPTPRATRSQTKVAPKPAARRPVARPEPKATSKPAPKPADPHAGHRPPG
jgi:hypothetical protein